MFEKKQIIYSETQGESRVDNHQVKLRELFTREEAQELLNNEETLKDENLKKAAEYVLQEDGNGTAGNT